MGIPCKIFVYSLCFIVKLLRKVERTATGSMSMLLYIITPGVKKSLSESYDSQHDELHVRHMCCVT